MRKSKNVDSMQAQDMFRPGAVQLFNLKTGDWLCTVDKKNEFNFECPILIAEKYFNMDHSPEEEKEIVNKNQISLF